MAGVYLGTTLLLLRLADRLGPMFGATELFHQMLALTLTLGFPVFLVIAWRSYGSPEIAEQGSSGDGPSKLEIPDDEDEFKIPLLSRTRLIDVALLIVLFAVAYLYAERFVGTERAEEPIQTQAAAEVSAASIAVLPFANFSGDESFAYFAAGVHEDVLTYVSRIPDLLVISRTSVMHYRETEDTIPKIAKTLGVAHILEGSVRRAGNRVRITVQLIRASDDAHLWAENYDRELTDIFDIQTEVAKAVAGTLSSQLAPALRTGGREAPTGDPQAYDWFVRGRELIRLPSAASAHDGLALFEKAVGVDPDYADAHAGIALALLALTHFDMVWEDVSARAIEHARRAIALDPRSSYAEYAMGVLLTGVGKDLKSGEAHLKRAIELDPNSGDAYLMYSENLYFQSRYEEAFVQISEAARRDPLSPQVQLYQARILLLSGKRAEALHHVSRAIELNPDNAFAHLVAGRAYGMGNELPTALAHYGQARMLDPGNSEAAGAIAGALTRLSALPAARAWLEEQLARAPASDAWFFRQSQLLMAEGLHDALDSHASDWERYNPDTPAAIQVRGSAASLGAQAARRSGDTAAAKRQSERAIALLEEFLAPFRTPEGYRAQFNNIWQLLSLGVEKRLRGDDSAGAHFQAVLDLYAAQPKEIQLPNQRIHSVIAHAALGESDEAIENMRLSLASDDYTDWVFVLYDLADDHDDVYHGITDDPEFQELLAAMRADLDRKVRRLSDEFPAILDPAHPDWERRATIDASAAAISEPDSPSA